MAILSAETTSSSPRCPRSQRRGHDGDGPVGTGKSAHSTRAQPRAGDAPSRIPPWLRLGRARITAILGAAAAVALVHGVVGLRAEHWVSAGLFVALVLIGGKAFRLALLMMPMPLVLVLYDLSRFTTGLRAQVHVADLYNAELRWFGVGQGTGRQLLTDVLAHHSHTALDFVCGLAYLVYLYMPMVMALLLFRHHRRTTAIHSWSFLLVNVMGLATHVIYPAAPPWYVAQYGLGPAQLDVLPDAAGAARFDALLGIDYFANFYGRSANVFGAMPSLHTAYPVVGFVSVVALGWRWAVPTGAFALLVAFSAVYLQHHYVWDVVVGALYAVVAWAIVRVVATRVRLPGLIAETSRVRTLSWRPSLT